MNRRFWHLLLTLGAGLAPLAGGCCPPRPPIVSVERIVGDYNANANTVPRLWARADVRLTVTDAAGLPWRYAPSTALLILQKGAAPLGPHNFVLIGKEAGQEVFRMGNSLADEVYYMWFAVGDRCGAIFGRTALAGAPGVEDLPIDPLGVLSLLTVNALPADLTELPVVTLRLDESNCRKRAYVLTQIQRQPVSGRIVGRREIYFPWQQGQPLRPFMVKFLDNKGQTVMVAELDDYRPIDTEGLDDPPARPPLLATDIDIRFPLNDGRIELTLSEMTTLEKFSPVVFEFLRWLPKCIDPRKLEPIDAAAARRAAASGSGS